MQMAELEWVADPLPVNALLFTEDAADEETDEEWKPPATEEAEPNEEFDDDDCFIERGDAAAAPEEAGVTMAADLLDELAEAEEAEVRLC